MIKAKELIKAIENSKNKDALHPQEIELIRILKDKLTTKFDISDADIRQLEHIKKIICW